MCSRQSAFSALDRSPTRSARIASEGLRALAAVGERQLEASDYNRATMGWRDEVEARIAEMENYRLLQQEARRSARSIGGPEAEHLEAQVENVIRKVSKRVNDLRASLE